MELMTKKKKTADKAKKTTKPKAKETLKTKAKKPTAAEMRVAIAKDVLKQLGKGSYVPRCGTWVHDSKLGDVSDFLSCKLTKGHTSVNTKEFTDNMERCEVCVLGSIFLSQTRLGSTVFRSPVEAWDLFEFPENGPLGKYFTSNQLQQMEVCFEGEDAYHTDDMNIAQLVEGHAYYNSYRKADQRFSKIMENLVRNKGEFIPHQDVSKDQLIKALNKQAAYL